MNRWKPAEMGQRRSIGWQVFRLLHRMGHSLLNLGWRGKRHWVHGIIRKKVFLGAWLERHQSWIASFK